MRMARNVFTLNSECCEVTKSNEEIQSVFKIPKEFNKSGRHIL